MAEILNTLKSYIKVKDIDEDNLTFKLFYRVSVGLCMLGVVLVAATQYIGSPIKCDIHDDSVDLGMFQAHCWIHGTYHIPLDILSKKSCIPRETIKVKFCSDFFFVNWNIYRMGTPIRTIIVL